MPQQQKSDIPDIDLSDIPDIDISDIPDAGGPPEESPGIISKSWEWMNTPLFGGPSEPTTEEWATNPSMELARRSAWAQATTPFAIAGEVAGAGVLGLGAKKLLGKGAKAADEVTSLGRIAEETPSINKPVAAAAETINQAPFNRAEAYKALVAMGEDPKVLGKMKNADMQALQKSKGVVKTPAGPISPNARNEAFKILVAQGGDPKVLGRTKTAELQRMLDELNAKKGAAPSNDLRAMGEAARQEGINEGKKAWGINTPVDPNKLPKSKLGKGKAMQEWAAKKGASGTSINTPTSVPRNGMQVWKDLLRSRTGNAELDNMIKEVKAMDTKREAHWSKGYNEEEFEVFRDLVERIRKHPSFPKQLIADWDRANKIARESVGPKAGAKVRVKDEVDAAATQREAITNRNKFQVVGDGGGINVPPGGGEPPIPPPTPPSNVPPDIPASRADDLLADVPSLDTNKPGLWTRASNASRALQSTWDASFPFRQGAGYAGRKAWRNSWDKMVKAGLSDESAQVIEDTLRQREYFKPKETPIFRIYKDGKKVPVTDPVTGLQKMKIEKSFAEQAGLDLVKNEEIMQGAKWIKEHIPGVKASDRAFTAFGNQVRADAFESLVEQFKKVGIDVTLPENFDKAQDIAKIVNAGTGRGSLKTMEDGAGKLLSKTFFSPKFMASRINMMQNAFNPQRIAAAAGGDEGAKILLKEAWKQLGSLMGVWSTTSMLGQAVGGVVDTDPNSADFGKIQIGNTRLDPGAGAQQYLVLMSRMLSGGQTSSTSGRHYQYGSRYGIPTQRDALVDFAANRLSPLNGFVARVMNASMNRPVDINDQSMRLAMPFAAQTLFEVAQEDPYLLPLIMPLTGVGFGTQTYDESGQGHTVWPESIGGEGIKYRGGSPFNPN